MFFRRSRFGRVILTSAILLLFLISWPPFEWAAAQMLESRYRRGVPPAESADAIVVLASSVDPPRAGRPIWIPDRESWERAEYAAWLHRNWRSLPVLACGGTHASNLRSFATVEQELLQRAGVPPDQIWVEERSRSTHKNATYGAEILRSKGVRSIALVVEARSMPRAEACFRREGFRVLAAPSTSVMCRQNFQSGFLTGILWAGTRSRCTKSLACCTTSCAGGYECLTSCRS